MCCMRPRVSRRSLVLVLGLLLYAISARDPFQAPGGFDWLQLVLVGVALLADVLMLGAMVSRIAEFGFSANKVSALGLNLVLAANLGYAAWLGLKFVRKSQNFAPIERWQTSYLPRVGRGGRGGAAGRLRLRMTPSFARSRS